MENSRLTRVRFGSFELDLESGELRSIGTEEANNNKVLLREQSLLVLRILIERRGKIVTREEIKKKLWPNDTIVDFDHSINATIKTLRRALGDSADKPQYIETLARRGYRLRLPVEWLESTTGSPRSQGLSAPVFPEPGGLIGRKVSHYRVLEVIGAGGMGMVFKAEDLKLGRLVALKFLPEEFAGDAVALKRFEREAQTASALNHRNICTIYEIEEHERQPFIVMELLEGDNLRDRLSASEPKALPPPELLVIAVQICDGLQAAHDKGIIHRDIKPANIFLTWQGTVKILDFGLAKLAVAEEGPETVVTNVSGSTSPSSSPGHTWKQDASIDRTCISLTGGSMAAGTAGYMSPEQVRKETLDLRTDLFSFGMVLYEMATGQRAFEGNTVAVVHDAILHKTPVPARDLNSAVPRSLDAVITKALEKDREKRYRSTAEMTQDLQRLKVDTESGRAAIASPAGGLSAARKLPGSRWLAAAGAATLIAGLVAGGWQLLSRKPKPLTDKDTIVLADFTNSTGDTAFDTTLRQGLSVQLEQSPFLRLVSDKQIEQTLPMMGQKPDAKLTLEIARQLCQRTGSAAVLDGSIAQIGTKYLLTLKAVNCASGESLASAEAEATDKNLVLDALGRTDSDIRSKLGESLATVQKFDVPLEQATTSSLEALQAYSLGRKAAGGGDPAAAVSLFQRAIGLDPNFAMAYATLGVSYSDFGETTRAAEATRKAYDLRERVSQWEKFYIESDYYLNVVGDLVKARQINELWEQAYPRSDDPRRSMFVIYTNLGQHDKALTESREALRLDSASGMNYANLVISYLTLDHLEKAQKTADETQLKKLDSPDLRWFLYQVAFSTNDAQGMSQQAAWFEGKPEMLGWARALEFNAAYYFGKVENAREYWRQGMAAVVHGQQDEAGAVAATEAALHEALSGNASIARERAQYALRLSKGRDVEYGTALALAFAGDLAQAQKLTDDLATRFPQSTVVWDDYLPTLHAQLALSRKDASKAIEVLRVALPYELGRPAAGIPLVSLYPAYVRGQAYLAAHQPSLAAAEFQKIIDHRGLVLYEPIGALSHVGLARAYAMRGDTAKATVAYQNFLALWKDADPDIPILKQVKAEYARLK